MQLKSLEMCGFKSFANRTSVVFNPGITAIVGPNGCGKSNVVDAIKWVLGTLSYKSVRGEEMLDVIFKGAEGVSGMGFAEVSLTLDNSDHTLPLEFEEVTITRRIHSSGEGEYFINKASCRLKDIREMLYGTGIGTDNYSVIEQGKIDKLVLSNPHERRLVFDEAAGISKYRARKRETENRLGKVSQDLLRMQDVVHEVQKQLRSIRAQAGRAQRYRELTGDLKSKRTRFCLHEHRSLTARGAEIEVLVRGLEERKEALRTGLEQKTREMESAQARLEEAAGRHADLASRLTGLESEASFRDKSIETAVEREVELQAAKERMEVDRGGLEKRSSKIEELAGAETRNMAEVDRDLQELAEQEAEAKRRLEDATRECARLSDEMEAKKAEAVELAHKEAQYRNERERISRDLEGIEGRSGEIVEQGERLATELADLGAKLGGARTVRSTIEQEIAAMMERKRSEDAAQAKRREERTGLEGDLVQLREAKDRRAARRETLRDLEEQLEGLEAGAQTLLRERPEGVLGSVADLLEADAEHAAVIEAALGERAGAVVCGTTEQAERAAALVRDRGLGRTVVVTLDRCPGAAANGIPKVDEVLGCAASFVRVEEGHAGLAEALLGRTLVVSKVGSARDAAVADLTDRRLVTMEGDVYEPGGIMATGGTRGASGLISRKSELRQLEQEIEEYLGRIADRESRREEVDRSMEDAEARIDALRQEVYEKSVSMGETATKIEQMAVREQFLSNERDMLKGELGAIGRQAQAMKERGASLETLLAKLEWLKARVQEEVVENGRTLEGYEAGKDGLQDGVSQARVETAQAAEKRVSLEKRLEMLWRNRQEATQDLDRVVQQLGEIAGRLESAAGELGRMREEREAHTGKVAGARTEVEASDRQRQEFSDGCESAKAERARVEGELGPCDEELNRLRVEEEGLRVKMESITQRARDEMDVDLDGATPEGSEEAETDWDELGRQIEELRVKLAGFGNVNVTALDQIDELEEREKYLLSQREDLEKSQHQMGELIRQLNRESRELFDKTIDFVREQFNTIFRKVFGGGKADIIVEDEEGVDPMERGLEIMARPPAKELTSISLLSGGERSLTAIALVMALFRANPSPFCLLDEADAALDENNVERYAGLVREFASETQFIVITHNKRTMAVADALYGVTMERPGISKKVSVNLSGDEGLDILKSKNAPVAPEPAGK